LGFDERCVVDERWVWMGGDEGVAMSDGLLMSDE